MRYSLRKPLWERAKEERELARKCKNKDAEQCTKKEKTLLNAKPWWSSDWINSINGKAGTYPIVCRVEKVITEFPYDNESMREIRRSKYKCKKATEGKDHETADKSKDKTKRRLVMRKKPSLCLSVTLRPLSTILPPQHSEKKGVFFEESQLSLPPIYSVLTYPCSKAPFIVPFYFAYRLSLSISDSDHVKLLDGNGARQHGIVSHQSNNRRDINSSALDVFVEIVEKDAAADLFTVNKLDDFISKCYEADQNSSNMILPETELRAVTAVALYQCHKRKVHFMQVKSPEKNENDKNTVHVGDITNLFNWVLLTLPRWKEIKVTLGDGQIECYRSAWEFKVSKSNDDNQEGILAAALAPSVLITLPCTNNGGFICTLNQKLRSEIEKFINVFIEKTDKAAMFVSPITDKDAPEYNRFVPYCMSFRRILRRLKTHQIKRLKHNHDTADPIENHDLEDTNGCYYRSIGAVLSDITDIYQNCLLYNE